MKRNIHIMPLLVVGLILALTAPLAQAAQLVTFTEGRSIVVEKAEKRSGWYYLTLEGGGELGVPAERIASVEAYEAPPPSARASTTTNQAAAASPGTPPPAPSTPANALDRSSPSPPASVGRRGAQGAPGGPTAGDVAAQPSGEQWREQTRMGIGGVGEAASRLGGPPGKNRGRSGRRGVGLQSRKPPRGDSRNQ